MTKSRRSGRTRSRAGLPRITGAIFDLDDTLYDCFSQRVRAAHRYAAEAMSRAGVKATPEQIFRLRMKAYRTNPTLAHIDGVVCERYAVPNREEVARIAREAFFTTPVAKLRLFRGTRKVLRELYRRGVRNFIVSYGSPDIQRAKVAALGLDREPSVERAFYADREKVVTKDRAFADILKLTGAEPKSVLVVGDRYSGEIRAGNLLGLHTAHVAGGEFAKLKPAGREEVPEFEIAKIDDVLKLPFRFG